MSRRRPFRDAARRFLVWRTLNQMNGECTAAEIAGLTGIPVAEVRRICRDRGYELGRRSLNDTTLAVDRYFRSANLY